MITFDYKKFLIFAIIGVALWFIVAYFNKPKSEAATRPIFLNSPSLVLEFDIKDGGEVQYQGESIGSVFNFGEEQDTLTYQVYNKEQVTIENLQVVINLPRSITNPNSAIARHFGDIDVDTAINPIITSQKINFNAKNIQPNSTYSIELILPKEIVRPNIVNQTLTNIESIPASYWIAISLILPLITLTILVFYVWLARKNWVKSMPTDERDTPPDDSRPAEVSVIINGRVTSRSIAATLLNLAIQDFIYISQSPNGYSFGKRKPVDLSILKDKQKTKPLTSYEAIILDKIFTRGANKSTDSDIAFRIGHHIFSHKIARAYLEIYESVVRKGWLIGDPQKKFRRYKILAFAVIITSAIGYILSIFFGPTDNLTYIAGWAGVFLSGILMYQIVPFMPKRTKTGDNAYKEWMKFKNFLSSKKQISSESVSTAQKTYEKYLPYAIIFGVEVEWTERFMHLPFFEPEWYRSKKNIDQFEEFANSIFPIIGQVAKNLSKAREPYAI